MSNTLRRGFCVAAMAVVSVVGVACRAPTELEESSGAAVTDIPSSSVLDQGSTGNCWLYATAAWAESLNARATGDASKHLSPAYWNYWDWYRQILGGRAQLEFGGFWQTAADLARRYGMMPLGQFVSNEATVPVTALKRINEALAKGSLREPGARSNGTAVRQALDEAFGLSDANRNLLTKTFGADGAKTFERGAAPSGALFRASDLKVRVPRPNEEPLDTTFDEVIGDGPLGWARVSPPRVAHASATGVPGVFTAATNVDYVVQSGDTISKLASRFHTTVQAIVTLNALTNANRIEVGQHLLLPSFEGGAEPPPPPPPPPSPPPPPPPPPSATWRDFTLRLQRALNDGAPIPIAWFVSFSDVDRHGHFTRTSAASTTKSRTGWHESLLTDYEAINVPGFGTLKAGTTATAEAKQAALEPAARVSFFRIKNSWGSQGVSWFFAPLAGFNDLDDAYLSQSLAVCDDTRTDDCARTGPFIQEVVLPPGY